MKVDLSLPVLDVEGNEIKDNDKILSYYSVFRTALIGDFDEKTVDQKFDDFKLALRLEKGKTDLTIDEIARIKQLVSKIPSTLVGTRVQSPATLSWLIL